MVRAERQYEEIGIRPAPVLKGVAAVLAVMTMGLTALYLYQGGEHGLERETGSLAGSGAAMPRESFDRIQRAERRHLASYGWIDRDAGIVHVPVAEAAQLVLADGTVAGQDADEVEP